VEEDELGLQRAIGHATLVTCASCGRPTPIQSASVVPGSALEDGAEFQYLCQECQQALEQGEEEMPTTLA
jgi:hypothetical protein